MESPTRLQYLPLRRRWLAKPAAESSIVGFRFCRLIWVVVKILVPFSVLTIIRHLIFRVPKKGP